MSGLNFSRAAKTLIFVLPISSTLPSGVAIAATKVTNPYHVNVPASFNYNTTGVIRDTPRHSTISGPSQLSFNGVSNTNYVTGSNQTIQLGQFVVNPAKTTAGADAVTTYSGTPFIIQIRSPQYDKTSSVPLLANALPNFTKAFHLKTTTLNSLLIKGHLDGTVSGSGTSNVTATVDSTKLGSIGTLPKNTAVNYTFPVRFGDLKLPTSWSMNTTARALASTSATPAGTSTPTATTTTATTTTATTATNDPAVTNTSFTVVPPPSTSAQLLAAPAAEMITSDAVIEPTPTPEPATILIFAAALGGFAWSRRRSIAPAL